MDRVPSTESGNTGITTAAKLAAVTACAATGILVYQQSKSNTTKEPQGAESATVVHNVQVTEKISPGKTIYEVSNPGQVTKTLVHNVQVTETISPGKTVYQSGQHCGPKMVTTVVSSGADTQISMQMSSANPANRPGAHQLTQIHADVLNDRIGEVTQDAEINKHVQEMVAASLAKHAQQEAQRMQTEPAYAPGQDLWGVQLGEQAQAQALCEQTSVEQKLGENFNRCVHIDGKQGDHSFVVRVTNCCDALAIARPLNVIYTKEIPYNFEDNTRLRAFDSSVLRFAGRYIDAYKKHKQDIGRESIHDDIFKLATGTVDACAEYVRHPKDNGSVAPFAQTRLVLVNYMLRYMCLTEFQKHIDEFKTVEDIRDIFTQLLNAATNDPSLIFVVDIAMFGIVHQAATDTRKPDMFESVAKEYIVSALAQIAYSPSDQDCMHLRTYGQKTTCMQQLNVYNHLFGLIIESTAFLPTNLKQKVQVANAIQTMLGHVAILTYLSQNDYVLKSMLFSADSHMTSERYVQEMLELVGPISPAKVETELLCVLEAGGASNSPAFYTYNKIYKHVIGHAVRYSEQLKNSLKQLYEETCLLSSDESDVLKALTTGKISEIPEQGRAFELLEKIWKLEHQLYQSYVKHHSLDIGDLYCSERAIQLLNSIFYLKSEDFDRGAMDNLRATFTSPYLNKHNDPNVRSYASMLVELCDPDHRLSGLFTINLNRHETSYLSSSALQMARSCAKKARALSGFTAEQLSDQ